MTLHDLLDKPVWQMTGEELLFLAQHGQRHTETNSTQQTSAKEQRRFVYGLSGLARLFGCSLPTANRIKQSRKINELSRKSDAKLSLTLTLPLNWQGAKLEDADEQL